MFRREMLIKTAAASAALAGSRLALAQATQGVSKNQIVLGTIQDLSGPLAALGKPILNGLMMSVDQANEKGGVHGRTIKLLNEDSGYDPKRAVLAAQKLLSQDKVFALLGVLGTAVALPTQKMALDRGVPTLFPVTAHHGMFEPLHKYKFALATPYPTGVRLGLRELFRMKPSIKRLGILYQDDEFGLEVLRGTETVLKEVGGGIQLVERTSYKRGATEFSSQMQKLKAANVDLIVLGTIIRETIGAMGTVRQLGYTGEFFGSEAAYMTLVSKLGGKAVEGLYAVGELPVPIRNRPDNPRLFNEWYDAYKARFNEDPDLFSAVGWVYLDVFVKAAQNAGPGLTADSLCKALESHVYPRGFLGNPEFSFSPTNHLGNNQVRLAQIQNGLWTNISDFLKG